MPPITFKALVKDYCSNCTFAGVRFVADDTKHWSERWFWFGLVVLSWYGSALLIIAAFEAFTLSPISFGLETTYTTWDTQMPAVAICETSNDAMLYNVSDSIWTIDHAPDLEDGLNEIAYFRGYAYRLLEFCYKSKDPDPKCPVSNFSSYSNLVRSRCSKILTNCYYNGKAFDCCEYFSPIDTDMGQCFIINSLQTIESNSYPMISNLTNKRSVLSFDVVIASTMYTLGEDEVPTVTTLQSSTLKIQLGRSYQRWLAVKNIQNDPNVVHTLPEQRACFFHNENTGGLYPHYSYSACTVLCRKKAQIDKCKCNDHFMLGTTEEDRCNISGLSCLHKYANHLTTLKPRWATRPGLSCDCLPSCDETDINVIEDFQTPMRNNRKKASVKVILSHLATERFKRNVVRSRLDLVVSVGGTTGLFVGASLLSFVELVFYFTARFAGNLWIAKHQKQIKNAKRSRKGLLLVDSLNVY